MSSKPAVEVWRSGLAITAGEEVKVEIEEEDVIEGEEGDEAGKVQSVRDHGLQIKEKFCPK